MKLWKALWADENGFVVTAEAALLATVGVIGATVGVSMAAKSVDAELQEAAYAFRSLDQSYGYRGFCNCRAYTAGSCYTQPPVEKSLRELRRMEEKDRVKPRRESDDRRRRESDDRRRRKPDARRKSDDRRKTDDRRERNNDSIDNRSASQPEDLKV